MPKILLVNIFIIFSIILNSIPAISENRLIKYGYVEFPPLSFTNEDNKPDGALIKLVSRVMAKAGYEWSAASYPGKRLIQNLEKGDIHLWIGISSFVSEDKALIGDSVVAKIELQAYTIGNKPPILKQDDLKNKSIIILGGYSYGGWREFIKNPDNKINYTEVYTHDAAFKMLNNDRADYVLDYKLPSDRVLKEITIPSLRSNLISSLDCHFVVSKNTLNADNVLRKLEAAYKDLLKEGKADIR